jgi:hypothetical protein
MAGSRRVAGPALAAVWGFAEATLFFVVPDVLIAWLAVARGWRVAVLAAGAASLGAAAGGMLVHAAAVAAPEATRAAILAVPAISDAMVAAAEAKAADGWFAAALGASVTGVPYKIYAMLAPAAGWDALSLALATPVLRLPRFLAVALAFAAIGRAVRRNGALPRWAAPVFTAGWVLFYAVYWTLTEW